MKLLYDQNLSRHLVARLAQLFPDSAHVATLGLDTASDREVWDYAGEHGMYSANSQNRNDKARISARRNSAR